MQLPEWAHVGALFPGTGFHAITQRVDDGMTVTTNPKACDVHLKNHKKAFTMTGGDVGCSRSKTPATLRILVQNQGHGRSACFTAAASVTRESPVAKTCGLAVAPACICAADFCLSNSIVHR